MFSIIERYDHVGIKLVKVGVSGVVPVSFSPELSDVFGRGRKSQSLRV